MSCVISPIAHLMEIPMDFSQVNWTTVGFSVMGLSAIIFAYFVIRRPSLWGCCTFRLLS